MGIMVKYYHSDTSVGGSLSFNTDDLRGKCERLFLKPPTEAITYDITLTDDNSLIIYSQQGIRGTLNDISGFSLRGIYTVSITNISVDGIFKFQVEFEEKFS